MVFLSMTGQKSDKRAMPYQGFFQYLVKWRGEGFITFRVIAALIFPATCEDGTTGPGGSFDASWESYETFKIGMKR